MNERRVARTRAAWLLASLLVAKIAMADSAPPDPRRRLARKLVIAGEVLLGAGYALFTVPALVQAGGAALIIAGIVVNRRARSDVAPR